MLLISSLILCAFTTFYFYVKQCNNYWKKHGIVSLKSNFLFGTSFDFVIGRRSLEQIHHDNYKAKPNEPYVGMYNMLKPVLFIRDPDLLNQILVKDFSYFSDRGNLGVLIPPGRLLDYNVFRSSRVKEWKIVRNTLSHTFSGSKMKKMYDLMEGCAKMLMENHFRPASKTNKPVDVRELMSRYALDVLGCCAFGLQFNTLKDSDSFFHKIATIMTDFSGLRSKVWFIFRRLIPNNIIIVERLGIKRISYAIEDFFFSLLHEAEELRRKETESRCDFLQLMLDIRDDEENKASYLFTNNHIASNMFAFYFAGRETSSSALAFALYELAIHPHIQDKLREEIKIAIGACNGVINYDTVKKITYLEMVLSETLRLHAPVPLNARTCTETYQLPGTSYKIRPGDKILYSIAALHKDEKYFPNPEIFDPENFSDENIARRNPNVYQPFGWGPRTCIGMRFAKLEMKICLVHILLSYKLSRCSKTEVPFIINPKAVFDSAKNGIWLTVEEICS